MAVVLIISTEKGPITEYPVLEKCTVGRSYSCDLIIEDKQMSGKHGVFEFNDKGQLFYTDLGSTNGSFVLHSQIKKIQFRVYDILTLGNTTLTIDEKKLNARERIAIGTALAKKKDSMLTLPAMGKFQSGTIIQSNVLPVEVPDPSDISKSVVVNKNLRKRLLKSNQHGSDLDGINDDDEKSGLIQLELEGKGLKRKKRG
jgi:pSer/pThr/pTyr-binding forkhead associated (FHA) protein